MEFYSSVWNPPKIFLLLKKRISEPFLQKKIGENRSDRNFVKWDNFKGFHTLSSTMYYVKGVCVKFYFLYFVYTFGLKNGWKKIAEWTGKP